MHDLLKNSTQNIQVVEIKNLILSEMKQKLSTLENFEDILTSIKLFSKDESILKKLADILNEKSQKLTQKDWVDLLNLMSILRLRNQVILDTCVYNLLKLKKNSLLSIESIQKCLLSCGILNYHNTHLYGYLLENLRAKFKEISEKSLSENDYKTYEPYLISIVNSIGILHLNEKNTLKDLQEFLAKHYLKSPKLLISFVITCASLNYNPLLVAENKSSFETILSNVNLDVLNKFEAKEKLMLVNYVWSLCTLNKVNHKMLSLVLDENFYIFLIDSK
jgi:hypothetical protein